jgi:hypothetical protein
MPDPVRLVATACECDSLAVETSRPSATRNFLNIRVAA